MRLMSFSSCRRLIFLLIASFIGAATATCGNGLVGNGICSDASLCCSEFGWCGTSTDHCKNSSPNGVAGPLAPSPVAAAGSCGNGAVGNGICSDTSLCCSEFGWCGTSHDHCRGSNAKTPGPTTIGLAPPLPTIRAPSTPVTNIEFPAYANDKCGSFPDVMSVNVGYYQSWAIYRSSQCNRVFPSNINVSGNRYTHLVYSFASIDASYKIEPWGGNYAEEVPLYMEFTALKQTNPGLKTLIAVGGWSFNDPGSATLNRFSDASSTAANRARFAASCVDFCQTFGFDGVDLDWEYPGDTARGGKAADKANFALLVRAIRSAFDAAPEDLEVTMAIPIADGLLSQGYNLAALSQSVTYFNLMAYDLYGPWSASLGANADMPFIFDSIEYMLSAGVPRNKMVLGLAAYGHTFNLASASCTSPGCSFTSGGPGGCAGETGFMAYFTVDEYVQNQRYRSLNFNPTTGSMEMVTNDNVWISFDNEATLNIKADFASKSCMRGTMWWAVDMLKEPIVLTFGDDNGSGIDASPPIDQFEPVFCFSAHAVVETMEKGPMRMKDLQVGDSVRSRSGGFEKVYAFGHRSHSQQGSFLRLHPSGLELSSNHMVFVRDKGAIPAVMVRVGDYLENGVRVTKVETGIIRRGVYAPFTPSGTILVNNVTASSYVSYQNSSRLMFGSWQTCITFQWLDHWFVTPYRVVCIMFGMSDVAMLGDGLSCWTRWGHSLASWLFAQPGAVIAPLLAVLGLFASPFVIVEYCLWLLAPTYLYHLLLSTLIVGSIVTQQRHQRKAKVLHRKPNPARNGPPHTRHDRISS